MCSTALVDLSAFPPGVALQLITSANSGGISLSEIKTNLKSWNSGRTFANLVTKQANEAKPLNKEALQELASAAKSGDIDRSALLSSVAGFVLKARPIRYTVCDGLIKAAEAIRSRDDRATFLLCCFRDMGPLCRCSESRSGGSSIFSQASLCQVPKPNG